MPNHSTWSLSLGRWGGLYVRLHVLFVVFAAVTLSMAWYSGRSTADLGLAAFSLALLVVSVLLHEIAHCHAARRVGPPIHQIVLGPGFGMGPLPEIHPARAEAFVHLAGPCANIAICVVCSIVLLFLGESGLVSVVANPFNPNNIGSGFQLTQCLALMLWINWLMFLFNMLPAFHFDGGRALRALIEPVWPENSAAVVIRIARLSAIGMLVAAWFLRDERVLDELPLAIPLVLIAIYLFFSPAPAAERHDDHDREDDLFGYDFSQGFTSFEKSNMPEPPEPQAGPISRWLERRREDAQRRQRMIEAEDEQRVDEILARLHAHGMQSLSAEDRDVLDRVSARYRERMGQLP